MRADRLVAVLLLLQERGQVTAAEVAEELEVSERTARRDLDALGVAGLPVYSVRGRGGGWRLLGGGRTDLSGLNEAEARALFLVAGPQADATPEVRAALRKLLRALPEPLRERAAAASASVVVDRSGWDHPTPAASAPPLLDPVQRAVVDGVSVDLGYEGRDGRRSERRVHPLGLVSKGRHWYLLAGTDDGQRTFRVDRIRSVRPTGEPVRRPEGFDLAGSWSEFIDRVDRMRTPVVATGAAEAALLGTLRAVVGNRLAVGTARADGRVEVEVRGHSVRSLAGELAGFGAHLEVTGPPELRRELARVGRELVASYGRPRRRPG